jgi:hypothetical protein
MDSTLNELVRVFETLEGVSLFGNYDVKVRNGTFYRVVFSLDTRSIKGIFEFVNGLARCLGNADDFDAYISLVEMSWVGNKGVDGVNKPFVSIEIPIDGVESIVAIVKEYLVQLSGNSISHSHGKLLSPNYVHR